MQLCELWLGRHQRTEEEDEGGTGHCSRCSSARLPNSKQARVLIDLGGFALFSSCLLLACLQYPLAAIPHTTDPLVFSASFALPCVPVNSK